MLDFRAGKKTKAGTGTGTVVSAPTTFTVTGTNRAAKIDRPGNIDMGSVATKVQVAAAKRKATGSEALPIESGPTDMTKSIDVSRRRNSTHQRNDGGATERSVKVGRPAEKPKAAAISEETRIAD